MVANLRNSARTQAVQQVYSGCMYSAKRLFGVSRSIVATLVMVLKMVLGLGTPQASAEEMRCAPVGELFEYCQQGWQNIFIPLDANTRDIMLKLRGTEFPPEQTALIMGPRPLPDDPNMHVSSSVFVNPTGQGNTAVAFEDMLAWTLPQDTQTRRFFDAAMREIAGPGDGTLYISYFTQVVPTNAENQPRLFHVEILTTLKRDEDIGAIIVLNSLFYDQAALRFQVSADPVDTVDRYRNDFEVQRATHARLLGNIGQKSDG